MPMPTSGQVRFWWTATKILRDAVIAHGIVCADASLTFECYFHGIKVSLIRVSPEKFVLPRVI